MTNRKVLAVFAVLLVLTLSMPVAVGAKRPGFRPTHLASFEGADLNSAPQPVRQSSSIINCDPMVPSHTLTISSAFFAACSGCPLPGTCTGHLSITDRDHDGVWLMYFGWRFDDVGYRIEALGSLDQQRKFKPFTFTPTSAPEIWASSPGSGWTSIGYGTTNFTIEGEPIG